MSDMSFAFPVGSDGSMLYVFQYAVVRGQIGWTLGLSSPDENGVFRTRLYKVSREDVVGMARRLAEASGRNSAADVVACRVDPLSWLRGIAASGDAKAFFDASRGFISVLC